MTEHGDFLLSSFQCNLNQRLPASVPKLELETVTCMVNRLKFVLASSENCQSHVPQFSLSICVISDRRTSKDVFSFC